MKRVVYFFRKVILSFEFILILFMYSGYKASWIENINSLIIEKMNVAVFIPSIFILLFWKLFFPESDKDGSIMKHFPETNSI